MVEFREIDSDRSFSSTIAHSIEIMAKLKTLIGGSLKQRFKVRRKLSGNKIEDQLTSNGTSQNYGH